jgi:hypothetical protein
MSNSKKKPKERVENDLFNNRVDNLEMHVKRKQALADEDRYAILYSLCMHGYLEKDSLEEKVPDGADLDKTLAPLLNTNLIAQLSVDGNDRFRVTSLGVEEITNDIESII